MKHLISLILLCCLAACKSGQDTQAEEKHITTPQPTEETQTTPASLKEKMKPVFVASGFEPMWHLELLMAADSSYQVTFTNIIGEMTGKLKKVGANVYEGTVHNGDKTESFKLEISNKACMHEDGTTKDPQTATITFEGQTSSGCGKMM